MFNKTVLLFILIFFSLIKINYSQPEVDKVVNDVAFKFSFRMPAFWEMKDMKETTDKDAISYSFESSDKKMTIMLLAFKLNSVKNIEDFIYNLEKDISLNIPPKSGEYSEQDFGKYDMKSAVYKDNKFDENIYYYRTKLPDATNNFVYMLRFITETKDFNTDRETEIKKIASTFTPTAE